MNPIQSNWVHSLVAGGRISQRPRVIIRGGGGGGGLFWPAPKFVALPRICEASSSPLSDGIHGTCGQLALCTEPRPQWPIFAPVKPGTPPFCPGALVVCV